MDYSRDYCGEFLESAKIKHSDKNYDYHKVKDQYRSSRLPVEIVCQQHGSFFQRPEKHLKSKIPCPMCRAETPYAQAHKYPSVKVGDRFGKLTLTEYDKKRRRWICLCDCGNYTTALNRDLFNGRKSCRCIHLEERKDRRLPNNEGQKNNIMRGYKFNAKNRAQEFTLTKQEFYKLIESDCHYCGAKPSNTTFNYESDNLVYNGIDRIDNNLGYTLSNSVSCCKFCNRAKSTRTLTEFLSGLKLFMKDIVNK